VAPCLQEALFWAQISYSTSVSYCVHCFSWLGVADWFAYKFLYMLYYVPFPPITVAAQSEAWTIFALSNTEIVGSNPTGVRDVCVRLLCLCCPVCR
jgi:hypothetical protein